MSSNPTLRILCALSGGCDSAVSTLLSLFPSPSLLRKIQSAARENKSNPWEGKIGGVGRVEVYGVFMDNWRDSDGGYGGGGGQFCLSNSRSLDMLTNKFSPILADLAMSNGRGVIWGGNVSRLDGSREYWHDVWEPYVENMNFNVGPSPPTRTSGGTGIVTPNPDMACNRYIKFDYMRRYAFSPRPSGAGAHVLVTGHYASLESSAAKGLHMKEGADKKKDQSYFLSTTPAEQFQGVVFPLEGFEKGNDVNNNVEDSIITHFEACGYISTKLPSSGGSESPNANAVTTRDIARAFKLPQANAKDSQGICMVNDGNISVRETAEVDAGSKTGPVGGGKVGFNGFMSTFIDIPDQREGVYVDVDTNEVVATFTIQDDYEGCQIMKNPLLYTVGQNARIGGGRVKYFVVGRRRGDSTHQHIVLVAGDTRHPSLYRDEVESDDFNVMDGGIKAALVGGVEYCVDAVARVRHLQPLIPCTVTITTSGVRTHASVKFKQPVRAPCEGQVVCVYEEEGDEGGRRVVIGGGRITGMGKSYMEMDKEVLNPAKSGRNDMSV